jgi:hypothetical protein
MRDIGKRVLESYFNGKCMPKATCTAREVPKGEKNGNGPMHKGAFKQLTWGILYVNCGNRLHQHTYTK